MFSGIFSNVQMQGVIVQLVLHKLYSSKNLHIFRQIYVQF